MENIKAIIAAGGKGTRLRPLTFTSNKHLIPIANKPLLLYPFENIVRLGIKEIGIIVNETKPNIQELLGNGEKWGVKITYIDQPDALGLAHVVKISEKFIDGSPFIYHLGDNIFTKGIEKPFKEFKEKKPDAMLAVIEHEENFRLGVPFFENGKLVKVVEKPENPPNKFGVPGLYFFSNNVFKAFYGENAIKPSARGELEITDLYNYLLANNYKVEVAQIEGEWLDPGKFDDSLEANRHLLDLNCKYKNEGLVDEKSQIEGNVEIGEKSQIINSKVYGASSIGKNVYIENSNIGPHISISDNCRIVNSKVEDSIIMEGAIISDVNTTIKKSMIGKKSLITGKKSEENTLKLTISDQSIVETF